MKYLITLLLLASSCLYGKGEPNHLIGAFQRLSSVQNSTDSIDDTDYLEVSGEVIHAWNKASDDEKKRFSSRMFLVHFRRAQIMATAGNFKTAAAELTKEAKIQKAFDGRLEFATKSPDAFFLDLAKLQSLLTTETRSDPLKNLVDYYFERDGDSFIASRLELYDEVAGITVPGIESGEAIALVHRLEPRGGSFVVSATRWLVVPKGNLPEILKSATREIIFDTTGEMTVSQLTMPYQSIRSNRDPKLVRKTPNSEPKESAESNITVASDSLKNQHEPVIKTWIWFTILALLFVCIAIRIRWHHK